MQKVYNISHESHWPTLFNQLHVHNIDIPTGKYTQSINVGDTKPFKPDELLEGFHIKQEINVEGISDLGKDSKTARLILLSKDKSTLLFFREHKTAYVLGASDDKEELAEHIKLIKDRLVKHIKESIEGDQVMMTISYKGRYGTKEKNTYIKCPSVEDIKSNYAENVAASVEKLQETLLKEDLPGRVIFWYGPPGTGKTYLIRALSRFCVTNKMNVTVVTDPEAMVADNDYLMQICVPEAEEWDDEEDKEEATKRKLVVLEDVPSMVLESAREEKSTLMAKMLNITDGILGQGTDTVFLISSNNDINKVDPAFLRPGRALQVLPIKQLDKEFSNNWLKNKECDKTVEKEHTLAELYQIASGETTVIEPEKEERMGLH